MNKASGDFVLHENLKKMGLMITICQFVLPANPKVTKHAVASNILHKKVLKYTF